MEKSASFDPSSVNTVSTFLHKPIYIYTEVSKSVEECSISFRQSGLEQN